MLKNLLLEDLFLDIEVLVAVIVFFVFLVIVIVVGNAVQQSKKNEESKKSPFELRDAEKKTQAARLEDLRKRYQQRTGLDTAHSSLKGVDSHSHVSSEMEVYGDINGSLGEVNDEGCPELAGIRLISNDEAYDPESGEIDYNLQNIGLTMVLGEVLDKPKFKKGR